MFATLPKFPAFSCQSPLHFNPLTISMFRKLQLTSFARTASVLSSEISMVSTSQSVLAPFSTATNIQVLVDGAQPPLFVPNKRPGKLADAPAQGLLDAIATIRRMYLERRQLGLNPPNISQSFDVGIRLGVDPKRGDHNVRGVVVLPHGTGKNIFVAVFTTGVKEAEEARQAGADLVGGEELVERILEDPEGTIAPFKACVASPEMIGRLAKVARTLGPRGLMPNPKAGTLTPNVAKAVAELKKGRVEYRMDRSAWIRRSLGKAEFGEDQMRDNLLSFAAAVARDKPDVFQAPLSSYFVDAFVKTTLGPRVFVTPESLLEELRKAKLVAS